MANKVYFINASYIKEYTFVDPNVDEKYLLISIEEAQREHIRNYIGSGLYNELITQINANTLTSNNQNLLENYIIPALKWWTLYEAAPFLTFKFTNKTLGTKNSDNSSTIGANDLDKVMEMLRNKAESYTKDLINYILENESTFPLYTNPGNGIDTIFPRTNAFNCDIYLDGDNRLFRRDAQFMNDRNNERYRN